MLVGPALVGPALVGPVFVGPVVGTAVEGASDVAPGDAGASFRTGAGCAGSTPFCGRLDLDVREGRGGGQRDGGGRRSDGRSAGDDA
ncbi:hypothetical protein C2142_34925 [Streptomyces sp. CB01881]|nr:hypothetical protein C2142_34925 [Streptomyces sp. CB01881]